MSTRANIAEHKYTSARYGCHYREIEKEREREGERERERERVREIFGSS